VPASKMGEMAVEMLMEMIEGKVREGRQVVLDTELVIRESCRRL
jgi:DNA-binding LacI/PurR family transcriptional regulator